MAVNLIDSNDIKVIQSDNDIELQTDKTTLNTIINAKIKNSNTSSTTDTYSCDYIDNLKDTYSTSETLTNKIWIDNKPIYRKVLNIGARTYSQGNNNIAHNISNISKVIDINFMIYANNIWYKKWDNINNITATSTNFNVHINNQFDADDSFAIIEYTKSS